MRTDTSISPAQAANYTGRHKTTITRAIDEGKISAFRDEHGRLWIEPAELFRVFPSAESDAASVRDKGDATERITSDSDDKSLNSKDALHDAHQHFRIEALNRLLALEREGAERERKQTYDTISDLRRRLDASEEERKQKDMQLTHLLTDQRKEEVATDQALRGGFWTLFKRKAKRSL